MSACWKVRTVGADAVTPVLLCELHRLQNEGTMISVLDMYYLSSEAQAAFLTIYGVGEINDSYEKRAEKAKQILAKYDLLWILDKTQLEAYVYSFIEDHGFVRVAPNLYLCDEGYVLGNCEQSVLDMTLLGAVMEESTDFPYIIEDSSEPKPAISIGKKK